jgi:hypothetical protein
MIDHETLADAYLPQYETKGKEDVWAGDEVDDLARRDPREGKYGFAKGSARRSSTRPPPIGGLDRRNRGPSTPRRRTWPAKTQKARWSGQLRRRSAQDDTIESRANIHVRLTLITLR